MGARTGKGKQCLITYLYKPVGRTVRRKKLLAYMHEQDRFLDSQEIEELLWSDIDLTTIDGDFGTTFSKRLTKS